MTGARIPAWLFVVSLDNGKFLHLTVDHGALELHIESASLSIPLTSVSDLAHALSRAAAESTWRIARGMR